jgi:hypothetical protein
VVKLVVIIIFDWTFEALGALLGPDAGRGNSGMRGQPKPNAGAVGGFGLFARACEDDADV